LVEVDKTAPADLITAVSPGVMKNGRTMPLAALGPLRAALGRLGLGIVSP